MQKQFLIFIAVITSFFTTMTAYIAWHVVTRFSWGTTHVWGIILAMMCFVAYEISTPILYHRFPKYFHNHPLLYFLPYFLLGTFASLFFYTLATDLALLIWEIFSQAPISRYARKIAFLCNVLAAAISTIIGLFQTLPRPKTRQIEIPIKNLPNDFENLRIAQVTDLHISPTIGKKYVEKVVQRVNDLEADLIVITGDFGDGHPTQLREDLAPFSNLKSSFGKYFVTGNHEYYWDANAWIKALENLGLQGLQNQHVVIEKAGKNLLLVGMPDITAVRMGYEGPNLFKALEGAPESDIKILLVHQPNLHYREAAENGIHLQLSGHTHGGQFFPFTWIIKAFQKFDKGLHQFESLWIYVNRGTGHWGPPSRFLSPSEITVITLIRAD